MSTIVTLADKGFAKRHPKWRIATAPKGVSPLGDARKDKRIRVVYIRCSKTEIMARFPEAF